MVQPHELAAAYHDNVRNNQIGGQTDGVDAEIMADLGYETPERTLELITGLGAAASEDAAPTAEKEPVICGDCGQPIPCQHGNGRRTFGN